MVSVMAVSRAAGGRPGSGTSVHAGRWFWPSMLRRSCDTAVMDDDLLDRLDAAIAGLEATRPIIESGAPWPLAAVFDTSEEAEWGQPETLAHLAEMEPSWPGELERILAGGPDPVP